MRSFALILGAVVAIFSPHVSANEAEDAKSAADTAYGALFDNFWNSSTGDFIGTGNYWFFAHSIDVAVLAADRNPSAERLTRIRELYDGQMKRGFVQGAHVYFDDENWMALSLARAATLTGESDYLQMARRLFDDVLTRGTSGRTEGVWWNYEHGKVATASNAGPVITGILLWRLTGESRYYDFAVKNYAFWRREMAIEPTGLVYDQFLSDGSKDKTPWSYNQGLMIGAAVELYRATGDATYLDHARGYSRYMIDSMKSFGGVMIERNCLNTPQCYGWKDVAQFKGIAFRYMTELAKVDPADLELRDYLRSTALAISTPQVFDPATGRFAFEWDGSAPPSGGYYQTTNSAALALAAFATLF